MIMSNYNLVEKTSAKSGIYLRRVMLFNELRKQACHSALSHFNEKPSNIN